VSLENAKPNPQQPPSHVVHISQVVTETAFLVRADRLQATLSGGGGFVGFCQEKIDAAENEFEKTLWSFLKVRRIGKDIFSLFCNAVVPLFEFFFLCFQANFESDIRSKYLELLGYNKEELALKVSSICHDAMRVDPIVRLRQESQRILSGWKQAGSKPGDQSKTQTSPKRGGAENQRSGQAGRVRTGGSGIYSNNAGELGTKTQDNLAEDKWK